MFSKNLFLVGSATAATGKASASNGNTKASSTGSGSTGTFSGGSSSKSSSHAMATKPAYLPGVAVAVVGGLAAAIV